LNELSHLKELDSQYVVKYHGFSETDDFLYIILEQMNCNLSQFLSNHPNLNLNRKIEILLEAANCIHFLHKKNINHLDVKPSNFLLNEDGSIIKIADFGISKVKKTDGTSFTCNHNLGSNGYQAPEIFNGDFSPDSDIYSFGIMMFEIIFEKSRYTPKELSDKYLLQSLVKKGKRPNVEQFGNFKDKRLISMVGLMKKCWDFRKNQRPTTEEIIKVLTGLK
jgi:serine/threonine protein kinase